MFLTVAFSSLVTSSLITLITLVPFVPILHFFLVCIFFLFSLSFVHVIWFIVTEDLPSQIISTHQPPRNEISSKDSSHWTDASSTVNAGGPVGTAEDGSGTNQDKFVEGVRSEFPVIVEFGMVLATDCCP